MTNDLRTDPALKRPAPPGMLGTVVTEGRRRRRRNLTAAAASGLTLAAVVAVTTFVGQADMSTLRTEVPAGQTPSSAPHETEEPGGVVTRDYPLSPFTGIDLSGGLEVTIRQGAHQAVRVTAQRDLLHEVAVEASGGRLDVSHARAIAKADPIRVDITVVSLKDLDVRAGVVVQLIDLGDRVDRHVSLTGGSSLSGTLAAASLTLDLQGGAAVQLAGSTDSLSVVAAGGVQLHLASLRAATAALDLSAGVNASVQVTDTLSPVTLSSGSVLLLTGPAAVGATNIDSSSVLRRATSPSR